MLEKLCALSGGKATGHIIRTFPVGGFTQPTPPPACRKEKKNSNFVIILDRFFNYVLVMPPPPPQKEISSNNFVHSKSLGHRIFTTHTHAPHTHTHTHKHFEYIGTFKFCRTFLKCLIFIDLHCISDRFI